MRVKLGHDKPERAEETSMEFIHRADVPVLKNVGVQSEQLLFPENSRSARVTITRVTVEPGAANPRHAHESSEQVWALEGAGTLLLAEKRTQPIAAGDVVRFEDGDPHGFKNTGPTNFVYLSVTSPPLNFRAAYARDWGTGKPAAG
jgi:quercetin dioxygenase-like cupin family protein